MKKRCKYGIIYVTSHVTNEELVNIKQFAELHNQNQRTIVMYIKRHKEIFEGHIIKIGNSKYLDNEAITILENQYPLPKPIPVIENIETQKKYVSSLEKINYLQDKILDLQKQLKESKTLRLLLEKSQEQTQKLSDEIISLKVKIESQEIEYNKLKNRNLWERILNKD